jgi:hypothetical protein
MGNRGMAVGVRLRILLILKEKIKTSSVSHSQIQYAGINSE